VNTCEYVELLRSHPPSRLLPELQEMSAMACAMLRDAVRAFENEDVAMARGVIDGDDAMDAINARVMRDILDRTCTDQETVTGCISALVARSLERIGDYATNICEEVLYVVSGEDVRHVS
jgi:phosphate transport system protein